MSSSSVTDAATATTAATAATTIATFHSNCGNEEEKKLFYHEFSRIGHSMAINLQFLAALMR
ncbi:unnamed protein product [Ceratitis capitata]|uniref:(Mediterranean fruit fly) hypothetical protein n=1 Tax=Ceratitis capitata TaxID=7213 RepID=A0A811UN82_CERCA|nr:unnamed protein product [Ceratitis capitata]